MALTESNEFKTGTIAPDFNLINTVNNTFLSLAEAKGEKGTVGSTSPSQGDCAVCA